MFKYDMHGKGTCTYCDSKGICKRCKKDINKMKDKIHVITIYKNKDAVICQKCNNDKIRQMKNANTI